MNALILYVSEKSAEGFRLFKRLHEVCYASIWMSYY